MKKSVPAYAAQNASASLAPFTIDRRDIGPFDVEIEILYCGVCHTDIHIARNEWKDTVYPVVPGHEIVGRVTRVGADVSRFKTGDYAAVGCMVDACRTCPACEQSLEQYCEKGFVATYNGKDLASSEITYGGYSSLIVVDQRFVLTIPKEFHASDLSRVAPLLCAGITTYSPLRHWDVGPGKRVGIVGLGGLGHMGVQLAHAMGAHVVLFTSSAHKVADGKRLGADEVVISKDPENIRAYPHCFDFILDTVAAPHDLNLYLQHLKTNGTLCLVGVPAQPHPPVIVPNLIFGRKSLAGSLIGGIRETQELLNFCAAHRIAAEVEVIPIQKINEAYERMLQSDVKYRFVIDVASLKGK